MIRETLQSKLKKGATLADLLADLRTAKLLDGGAVEVGCDYRTEPYLDHVLDGWVDGPPSSNVVAVVSAKDPAAALWRRFTLSQRSYALFELDAFPTAFRNGMDPLSPGIPPGASRPRA